MTLPLALNCHLFTVFSCSPLPGTTAGGTKTTRKKESLWICQRVVCIFHGWWRNLNPAESTNVRNNVACYNQLVLLSCKIKIANARTHKNAPTLSSCRNVLLLLSPIEFSNHAYDVHIAVLSFRFFFFQFPTPMYWSPLLQGKVIK